MSILGVSSHPHDISCFTLNYIALHVTGDVMYVSITVSKSGFRKDFSKQ